MENRKVTGVVVICLVLGMLVGESRAQIRFEECYVGCFLKCVLTPGEKIQSCATRCLINCILPHKMSTDGAGEQTPDVNGDTSKSQTQSFCHLGCSLFSCANVSTPNNPGGAAVAKCVDSCGKSCATNYSP